jgi:cytochrome c oxidase subunit IV
MAGKSHRKQYLAIFTILAVLTALEVAVVYTGVAKNLMISALVLMALAKAGLVALYFMHLKYETKVLKMTVFLPFLAPALYAFVLIAESAWRRLG